MIPLVICFLKNGDNALKIETCQVSHRKQFAGCGLNLFPLLCRFHFGQAGADKSAAAALGFDESEQLQFVVGFLHGQWGYDQVFGQFAMRRELRPGLQSPGGNVFRDLSHDLPIDWKFVARMDNELHI